MSQYSVSGCIVTHNNMATIRCTLETLLSNTQGVDFTLFVVDNLSTDGTPELIRREYPQVEVILSPDNRGFGAGHNTVLDRLTSEFHAIINPDISMDDNVLYKLASFLRENPDIGLVSPRICFPDGREQILGKRNPCLKYLIASRLRRKGSPGKLLREYAMLDADYTRPFDIENATGCFMFLRTELFKQLGGFDERYFMYFEDSDLTRSVRRYARAVYHPFVKVFHVWTRASKKNMRLLLVQIQSMVRYLCKWRKQPAKSGEGR